METRSALLGSAQLGGVSARNNQICIAKRRRLSYLCKAKDEDEEEEGEEEEECVFPF